MNPAPAQDAEIIRRYRDCGESQRAIAKALGVGRSAVNGCLVRRKIAKRPVPPAWTDEEKRYLIILCNSKNLSGQDISGQEFKKFFPDRSYSSIKHHRDTLRRKSLI